MVPASPNVDSGTGSMGVSQAGLTAETGPGLWGSGLLEVSGDSLQMRESWTLRGLSREPGLGCRVMDLRRLDALRGWTGGFIRAFHLGLAGR
jgi:hypothetical protein